MTRVSVVLLLVLGVPGAARAETAEERRALRVASIPEVLQAFDLSADVVRAVEPALPTLTPAQCVARRPDAVSPLAAECRGAAPGVSEDECRALGVLSVLQRREILLEAADAQGFLVTWTCDGSTITGELLPFSPPHSDGRFRLVQRRNGATEGKEYRMRLPWRAAPPDYTDPAVYHDVIARALTPVEAAHEAFAAALGKKKGYAELEALVAAIDAARARVAELPSYRGDDAFRAATLAMLDDLRALTGREYRILARRSEEDRLAWELDTTSLTSQDPEEQIPTRELLRDASARRDAMIARWGAARDAFAAGHLAKAGG